jgi:hypothetical protein
MGTVQLGASVRIILLGGNHELQWKDPTGDLRQIIVDLVGSSSVDLVAEEATELPTTVAQRLACELDKPWIEIDLSRAERKLIGIADALDKPRDFPLPPFGKRFRAAYLPKEDGIREEEWRRRILKQRADVVLCLCGYSHLDPFTKKLEEAECQVEKLTLTELQWFKDLYGTYSIVEENGQRYCEVLWP